jgi:hypothetical protein
VLGRRHNPLCDVEALDDVLIERVLFTVLERDVEDLEKIDGMLCIWNILDLPCDQNMALLPDDTESFDILLLYNFQTRVDDRKVENTDEVLVWGPFAAPKRELVAGIEIFEDDTI